MDLVPHLFLMCFFTICLISAAENFMSMSGSIVKLADKSCTSTFLLESNIPGDFKFLNGILTLLSETHAGFLLMELTRVDQKQADRMRKSWSCFDIFNIRRSQENFTLDVSPFQASNSRQFYVMPLNQKLNQMSILTEVKDITNLQQPVSILSGFGTKNDTSDSNTGMWLWCPAMKRKRGFNAYIKKIDQFSANNKKWVNKVHKTRKIYRLCSDSPKQSYYQGREMGFTGILGFTIDTMAKIVAKALGSSELKMIYSNGCRKLRGVPKQRSTLGQIYHGLADFGSFVSSTSAINKKFDYMLFTFDDHFFLGQGPKVLSQHENLAYPFDTETWVLSLLSVVSMTYCFFWFNKINREGPMLNIFFLALGVMFMENHWKEYKTKISRALLLRYLWLFSTFVLSLAYQGTLKASLAKRTYDKPVETLEQMLELDLPVYSFIRMGDLSHSLSTHAKLYRHITENNTTISVPETYHILDNLFKGERAFIHSTSTYQLLFQNYFISKYGRRKVFPLVKVKEKFIFFHMTFVVKKYLAQTEEIKKVIDQLNDAGISEYVFKLKEDPFLRITQASDQDSSMSLNFDHILIVNCFLMASLILSFMVLLCEMPHLRSTYHDRKSTLRPYSGGEIRPFSGRPFSGALYMDSALYK